MTRNSSVMAMGTLGSRVLGFVRTAIFMMIAQTTVAADAFTTANNLPSSIYAVIATGVVSGILVPQITKAMKRQDGGEDFVNRLLTLSLLVVAGSAIVCTVGTPLITDLVVSSKANLNVPGFLHLTILLGYWCMPQVFFYGLYTVLGQVLNARGYFSAFAWAPAIANVVQIIGLIAFWVMWGSQPTPSLWTMPMIIMLGGSTTLGIAIQGIYLVWPLYRDGFRFHLRFGWRGYGFGEVSRMTFWTSVAVVASFIEGLVITWAANATRAGADEYAGNATQQNAYSLAIIPHSMVMVSVATVLFPALAKAWDDRNRGKVRSLVRQGLITPSLLIIPASVAMIAIGMPMIHTLYFPLNSVESVNVWWVLSAYSIGTWAYAITALKQRYYFAKQDGWTNFMLVLVMLSVELTVVLVAVWFLPGEYGVVAIALGRTAGSFASAGIFLRMVRREVGDFGLPGIAGLWLRTTAASAVAGVAAWGVSVAVGRISQRHMFAIVDLGVSAIVFVIVLLVMAAVMRITEITKFARQVLRRIERLPAPPRRKRPRPPSIPVSHV